MIVFPVTFIAGSTKLLAILLIDRSSLATRERKGVIMHYILRWISTIMTKTLIILKMQLCLISMKITVK